MPDLPSNQPESMLLGLQNLILEMIARGESLSATADRLCRDVETLACGIVCSVLTVDREGRLHPLAAPSLPQAYSAAIDGLPSGPMAGSCGTAAFTRMPVAVVDIATDPRWEGFRDLVLPLGFAACWSSPIASGAGEVVGTFAFYYREKRGPTPLEQEIVDTCVHLCAIAIERHERALERQRLAFSDELTGLLNRASFNADVASLASAAGLDWALLLVDIDNLKVVNDTFGHQAGDELIGTVGTRIASAAPAGRAYRLGGDEFAVLLSGAGSGGDGKAGDLEAQTGLAQTGLAQTGLAQTGPAQAGLADVAAAILAVLKTPAACAGHVLMPSATIGGAVALAGDRMAETVRQNADFALYHAKETCRGQFVAYTPGLGTRITRRFQAIRNVSAALLDERIDAFYQPIVRLGTREIVGFEALCRLTTDAGAVVPAAEFHEATSDVHVAEDLTRCMLARVAADVRGWLDLGIPFRHVGINVSSADFRGGRLGSRLVDTFQRMRVPLKHVILEVSEQVYLGQHDAVVAREVAALRAQGLRVALDDFGTGFASLTHLLSVPVDIIKIDKSFVDRLTPEDGSAAIIEGLVHIARKLDMRLIAEGVETADQATLLMRFGCALGQGYYYSRAVHRAEATDLLLDQAALPYPRRFARAGAFGKRPWDAGSSTTSR